MTIDANLLEGLRLGVGVGFWIGLIVAGIGLHLYNNR